MRSFLKYQFLESGNFIQLSTLIGNNTGEKLMEHNLKIQIRKPQRNPEQQQSFFKRQSFFFVYFLNIGKRQFCPDERQNEVRET